MDTPQILKHLRKFQVGYNVRCIRKSVQKEINVSTVVMAQPYNQERTKGWTLCQSKVTGMLTLSRNHPSSKSTRGIFHHLGEPTFLLIGQKNKQANNELEKMYRWQKFP